MLGSRTRVTGKTKSKTLVIFWVPVCVLSHVWLFATPLTVAHQAPLSMGFSRQDYWSGLQLPPPGNLPNPGTELASLAFTGKFLTTESPAKPGDLLRWTLSPGHEQLPYPATPQHNSRGESMSPILGRSLPKLLWERLKLTHTPT